MTFNEEIKKYTYCSSLAHAMNFINQIVGNFYLLLRLVGICLLLLLQLVSSEQIILSLFNGHKDVIPTPLDHEIYSNLFTYAHLMDISYCISQVNQIEEPFKCGLNCEKRFPNVTLVYQWYHDDSVCGYIATTFSNIFHYQEEPLQTTPKKTIIVSLRGTRSLFDTYADLKVDMTSYANLRYRLPYCGNNCKIHRGFYTYFQHLITIIQKVLETELEETENYELLILGHSMGGSIGLLIGLHFLDLGYDRMTLVTMGQPLVGNKEFAHWTDMVMGSHLEPKHNTYNRKFFRVIHKNDLVTVLPKNQDLMNVYTQFDNQIYLNCSANNMVPPPKSVWDCKTGDNRHCIAGDFDAWEMINDINRNYYDSHNTYFRKLGLCGVKV